jgi:exonuclease SbcD
MSKFTIIHVTDSQIQGINPKGRIDNFAEAMKAKFREIFKLAMQCIEVPNYGEINTIIVHSGDLFNIPDLSDSVAGEFAELFMECPVPIYVVPGNHDEFAHNLQTIHRTKLGLLGRVGVFHVLDQRPTMFDYCRIRIHLTGQGYHPNMDITGEDYMAPKPGVDEGSPWIVHAVHGMLAEEAVPGPHTLIKNCKTNAHVVLSGHLHKGFGLIARDFGGEVLSQAYQSAMQKDFGTLFCNPGALARVDADPEEMFRPVQIAVIEFTEDSVEARLVPITCAAPGVEVLSRDHIVKQTERDEKMKQFLSLLQQEGEMKFLSVQEIIKDISSRKAIPKHIVDDLLVRLARAREELGRKAG